jgi:hypothetical protein
MKIGFGAKAQGVKLGPEAKPDGDSEAL